MKDILLVLKGYKALIKLIYMCVFNRDFFKQIVWNGIYTLQKIRDYEENEWDKKLCQLRINIHFLILHTIVFLFNCKDWLIAFIRKEDVIGDTNPILWVDASDKNTIKKDKSNKVKQWNDKSGKGNHMIQKDTNKQPIFIERREDGK